MAHRIALESKTPLRLRKDNGEEMQFVIEKEIGRGGSCIVYEVSKETETGNKTFYRVKELYPYKLNISRKEDGSLIPDSCEEESFQQQKEKMYSDYSRRNTLFYLGDNYASMVNDLDVFKQNGTLYVLSAYSSEKTLATYKPESLKECIMLVKQAAYVLGNIHKQGYLYLDMKPDNVLVVDGLQKKIKLFDFNSLVSLADLEKDFEWSDTRLSYTRGFAPIELQNFKIKRLGPHTNVFGIGALLFYLLFGTTPKAPNCETDAEYDFSNIPYEYEKYDDKLFDVLTEFFHHALAIYYGDRYQSMQEVYEQLQKIEKMADVTIPRIFSTELKYLKPNYVYGREREFEELNGRLFGSDYNCLFITGMGGIGKSTFIKEYLYRYRKKFDTVLYMQFKESIEETISDDDCIEVNTLSRDEEVRSNIRYFDKKIRKIRELVRGTETILVIDNFVGEVDEALQKLLATECKVVLIRKTAPVYRECQKMEINAISDLGALRQIFENLGRCITVDEENSFYEILKQINSHTLVLELIAKQIANNRTLTITTAAILAKEHGFSSIAPEKVDCVIGNKPVNDTIGNIIDALFEVNALTENKKILMKVLSLVGNAGIDIGQFHQIMKISSKDDVNELIKDGWLMLNEDSLSMHSVIQEAVHRWEWTPVFMNAVERFLEYFYIEIRFESTKNNYPKKLHDLRIKVKNLESLTPEGKIICEWLLKRNIKKHGLSGKVTRERVFIRIWDNLPADYKKLSKLLTQAENILNQCKREDVIKNNGVYDALLYTTVLNIPHYREDYVLVEANQIFADVENDFVIRNTKKLFAESEADNAIAIMQLYARVVLIYAEYGRIDKAQELLECAKEFAKANRSNKVYGLYYTLLSDYYEICLDDSDDTKNSDGELLNKMLDAIEKTLYYSRKTIFFDINLLDINHLYIRALLRKIKVLLRSGRSSSEHEQIQTLLDRAECIIRKNTLRYADVRLDYYLVCGLYSALIDCSVEAVAFCVQEARKLAEEIIPTLWHKINKVLIPCADMFFELRCYEKAIDMLYEGTRLCVDHVNTEFYDSMKQKLCRRIWRVWNVSKDDELREKMIQMIETIENENVTIIESKNKVIIPEDIRSMILNKND